MTLRGLSRRGALPVLAALLDGHPEPLSATGFAREARLSPERARLLRDELTRMGLIQVVSLGPRGRIRPVHIHLTPRGRRVAEGVAGLRETLRS